MPSLLAWNWRYVTQGYGVVIRGEGQAMNALTISNAVIFDGLSDRLTAGSIHIEDGRIVAVGADRPAAERVIDARGKTVIPGLIDAHFHAYAAALSGMEIESSPLSYVALTAAARLSAALRRGFTTVRDVAGGEPGLARAIAQRVIQSPRYL